MDTTEILKKIQSDPDYIYCKRYDFSLKKILARYPEGVPTHLIAQCLLITEGEVEKIYNSIVQKLQNIIKKGSKEL